MDKGPLWEMERSEREREKEREFSTIVFEECGRHRRSNRVFFQERRKGWMRNQQGGLIRK